MELQSDLFDVIESHAPPVKEEFIFIDTDETDFVETSSKRRGIIQSELGQVFEDAEKTNSERVAAEKRRKNEIARKEALKRLQYFEQPKNDNEKLLKLQYDYLKTPNQNTWWKLVEFATVVTNRIAWKFVKERGIWHDKLEVNEKTGIAIEYVMRRYQDNIGYVVDKNYISFLKCGVKHAFGYLTKKDKETSKYDPSILVDVLDKKQIRHRGL